MKDIIRKARADDLPELRKLARNTIDKSYRSFLRDEGLDNYIFSGESDNEIKNNIDSCCVFLKDGSIAGFTLYSEDLIRLIMVDEKFQRSGIGSELLAHAESQVRAYGADLMRVHIFERNRQAVSFFRDRGWTPAGRDMDRELNIPLLLFEKRARD